MTKQESIEAFFKALGWEKIEKVVTSDDNFDEGRILDRIIYWEAPETLQGTETLKELPDIIDSYPSFKKYVLEMMEREGYGFWCSNINIAWLPTFDAEDNLKAFRANTKDNEITWAAVIAATRYLETKDD